VGSHDARSCALALRATVDLYRSLRQAPPAPPSAEKAAVGFLETLL
jgi:hypothetical protein